METPSATYKPEALSDASQRAHPTELPIEQQQQQQPPLRGEFTLPRINRWLIYVLILIIVFFSQLDQSSINFSIKQFKRDLALTDEEYGLFSSFNYLGKIAGSFVFMFLFNLCNRKYLCIVIFFMYTVNFLTLVLALPKPFLYVARTLIGFTNIFLFTYFPVWCDQYGIHKYKPLMITLIQVILPLGSLLGSTLSSIFEWRFALIVELSMFAIAAVIVMCISSDYFSQNIYSIPKEELKERKANDNENEIDYDTVSLFREGDFTKKEDEPNKESKRGSYKILITSSSFILWVFARAITYAPNLVLTNFLHEYLEDALGVIDESKRLGIYTVTGLIGPSIGAFLGGVVCTLLGGYETIKSRLLVVVTYGIYAVCALVLTQINSVMYFAVVYGVMMFIFAANVPILTGIVLSSVPGSIRATASSVNSFMYNFLGQFPAPYVYELLGEYRKDDPRFSMRAVIAVSVVPAVLFVVVLVIDCIKKGIKSKEQKREEGIEKIQPLIVEQEKNE